MSGVKAAVLDRALVEVGNGYRGVGERKLEETCWRVIDCGARWTAGYQRVGRRGRRPV